jgi:predicted GNAT family N-acyltransferase
VKPDRLFEGLTFKVASQAERGEALNLRREVYLEEFGDEGLDELDADAHHLIAVNEERRVIAALRIIDAEHRPFDLEHFVELPRLAAGRIPAEVARFCVAKDYRHVHRGQIVHLGLFKLLYMFALDTHTTDIFTLGVVELRRLYKFAFFDELDITCRHPIGDRPVQLMHLNLVDIHERYKDSHHPIAKLLFQTKFDNVML